MPANSIFMVFEVVNDNTLTPLKAHLKTRINSRFLTTTFRLLWRTKLMINKITYTQQGDYLLPDLKLPEQPKVEIGIWGKRHLRYIKQHHPIRYTNLLTSCKLTTYLSDIDEEATEMFDRLVKQLAAKEGVTEQLKAESQMIWIQHMNNIRNSATEIVNNELIYV